MKSGHWFVILGALPALAVSAGAQGIPVYSLTPPTSGTVTPIVADLIWQTTSVTPWGTFTQSLEGKFWRSRDGSTRQDNSYNTSEIHDNTRTWSDGGADIFIDHESKTATVQIYGGPFRYTDIFSGLSVETLRGVMDGRAVIGQRATSREATLTEVWTAPDLHVAVVRHTKGAAWERIQQMKNIQERDPDPELFKIPQGYSVVKCAASHDSGLDGLVSGNPISCSPVKADPRKR